MLEKVTSEAILENNSLSGKVGNYKIIEVRDRDAKKQCKIGKKSFLEGRSQRSNLKVTANPME